MSRKPQTQFATDLSALGLARPAPFVGRESEIAALADAFIGATCVVVHGAVGAGKTRLCLESVTRSELVGGRRVAYVRCFPGDAGAAMLARAERSLDTLPGSIFATLAEEPCFVVFDDVHHLSDADAAATLPSLIPNPGQTRVVFSTREVLPLPRRDSRRVDLALEGLDEAAARTLWSHLEETYGSTSERAIEQALTSTRGMPLAMRRAYARARGGADAWELDALSPEARAALEAVAVVRLPCAPAAIAAVVEVDAEPALIELVSRQLIDPIADGRFSIHDVVRDRVLAEIDPELRPQLERAAAELVSTLGRGRAGKRRVAWDAGDDGALGMLHPADRLREAMSHLVAAGDLDGAVAIVLSEKDSMLESGCGGEIVTLVDMLDDAGCPATGELLALRAQVATRQGKISEALGLAARVEGDVAKHMGVDPAELSFLRYRAGECHEACEEMYDLIVGEESNVRGKAAAFLVLCEIDRGNLAQARTVATAAFERDKAGLSDPVRAELHVALAALEEQSGRTGSARAALSRARNSGKLLPAQIARIDARMAVCLAREGRIHQAHALLESAERSAKNVDSVLVAGEVRLARARVFSHSGDLGHAQKILISLVRDSRNRGDETFALAAESALVAVCYRAGLLSKAASLAIACGSSARALGLGRLEAESELAIAAVEIGEFRIREARCRLERFSSDDMRHKTFHAGLSLLAASIAEEGYEEASAKWADARHYSETIIDADWVEVQAAAFQKDVRRAVEQAERVAVVAERIGRRGVLASVLALLARLYLRQGDAAAAGAAASRAAREAAKAGIVCARVHALLALAALSRDQNDIRAAAQYAHDAHDAASEAGLPVEKIAAGRALELIAEVDATCGADISRVHNAAQATTSEFGSERVTRLLAEFGFADKRPYRIVLANGGAHFVADPSPRALRLSSRSLAIDAVREVVMREGKQVADLRRRSLLKRLLFLFASEPERRFEKEQIVEAVWQVEYHPLRHDAALFTNIMRIRRLLGDDGAELLRVGEDGYWLSPPKDYIYLGHADSQDGD